MNNRKPTCKRKGGGRVDEPQPLAGVGESPFALPTERVPNPIAYVRYVQRGMSKRQAALTAGYSPTVSTTQIDRQRTVRELTKTVEDQRRELQMTLGTDFGSTAGAMADLVHTAEKDGDKINAARVINDMMGYNSPKELQIQSRSLIVELSAMSNSAIDDILKAANIEIPE